MALPGHPVVSRLRGNDGDETLGMTVRGFAGCVASLGGLWPDMNGVVMV